MKQIKRWSSSIPRRLWLIPCALTFACSSESAAHEDPLQSAAGAFESGASGAGDSMLGASGTSSGAAGTNEEPDRSDAGGDVDRDAASMTAEIDASANEGEAAPKPCIKGAVSGSQIAFIGDSFLAAPTSEIAYELENLLQKNGSTAYSATPRFRQLVGTTMKQIAAQYETEHMMNPDIKVLIANGGGNDVLVTDRTCLTQAPPANAGCEKTIDSALGVAEGLLSKAQSDGVEHVVYIFYPHEPLSGLFQGDAPTINDSLDFAEVRARAICEHNPICEFVSLRDAAGDKPGSGYVDRGYIKPNDVHPSSAGSVFFAQTIWDTMVEHCIAQ